MELKGKKIAFLGDSITEGVGTSAPEFRRKVVAIATEEDGIDRVYAMNLQFFPLTHKNTSNPKRKKENK